MNFIDTFEKSAAHRFARDNLSPDSFTHVCVRRGVLRRNKDEIYLDVARTVLIRYGKDGNFKRDVFLADDL